jgi:hypothetical protein
LFELEHVKKKITDRNATTAIFIHANLSRESKTEWKYHDPYALHQTDMKFALEELHKKLLFPNWNVSFAKKKKIKSQTEKNFKTPKKEIYKRTMVLFVALRRGKMLNMVWLISAEKVNCILYF